MKNIITWFNGKKRRIALYALAVAPMIPEKYAIPLYLAGIAFGGADAVEKVVEIRKNRKQK